MRLPRAFLVGSASHTGRVRVNNEDDYLLAAPPLPQGELLLCAIADGMGGVAGGAEASRAALRALGGAVLEVGGGPLRERLADGFRQAAARVLEQAAAIPALRGMGTTLTALGLEPGRAWVGHVGDTRLYRLRGGRFEQLTEDHAARHQDNLLTRCIGAGQATCAPDLFEFATAAGDRYVLVSDGVWGVLPPAQQAALVARDAPQSAAEQLVAAALRAGGPDNATAVVVDVLSVAPSAELREVALCREERPGPCSDWPRPRSLRPPLWPWVALLLAGGLLAAAALRWWGGVDLLAPLVERW